jgi:hypothetical protein
MHIKKINIAEMAEKIKALFEKKPILVVIAPLIFLVLLAIPVVVILTSGGRDTAPPSASDTDSVPAMGQVSQTPTVEILPDTERADPEKDPFGSSGILAGTKALVLKGIISNSDGIYTAIISAGDTTYIVGNGQTIANTDWSVTEINDTGITLSDGETEKTLQIDSDA